MGIFFFFLCLSSWKAWRR